MRLNPLLGEPPYILVAASRMQRCFAERRARKACPSISGAGAYKKHPRKAPRKTTSSEVCTILVSRAETVGPARKPARWEKTMFANPNLL